METKKNNLIFNLTQTFIWVCVFVLPALMNWVIAGNKETALKVFLGGFFLMLPLLLIYLVNYHAFIPRLLYRGRKQWFFLCNILLLFLLDIQSLHPKPLPEGVIESIPIPENEIWAFYGSLQLGVVIVQLLFILLAVGVRQIRRNHELQIRIEEEKRKGTEAELTWLKNQLNPHFLFNTLNNISSLTQIDPDKAQDSIGQLSDLLRYALYESKDERVPLSGEVTFMDNYIDLMQLRCNEMTTVEKDFQVPAALYFPDRECLQAWRQRPVSLFRPDPDGRRRQGPGLPLRKFPFREERLRPHRVRHRFGEHAAAAGPALSGCLRIYA